MKKKKGKLSSYTTLLKFNLLNLSSMMIFLFVQVFLPNVTNKEAGIAQVANNNKLPVTDSFTSPLKDAVTNTSSI